MAATTFGLTGAVVAASPANAGASAPPTVSASDFTTSPLATDPAAVLSTPGGGAQSDPSLLALTGTAPTPLVVKLAFAPVATYAGGVSGLAATSPAATRTNGIDESAAPVRAYAAYADGITNRFTAALKAAIPSARIGARLQLVYGGIAVQVPANRVADVARMPGVVAVQRDREVHNAAGGVEAVLTGASTVWPSLGGTATAGSGVTIGMVDTGIWPEHPSFKDPGTLPAVPALPGGRARPCDFGDNPLTTAVDPFACNRKVISGQSFLATYTSYYDLVLPTPRDADGHGTLTAASAAGNVIAHAKYLGNDLGAVSGTAPGARLAIYKSGDVEVSFTSDDVAAVGQAVADQVDIISASIGATGDSPWQDPLQLAYLDAYANGISVFAAAGNDGPTASSIYNIAPWVTTVGATQGPRGFGSSLTLTASGATALTLQGTTFTKAIATAKTVADAASVAAYADGACTKVAKAKSLTGLVVLCRRDSTTLGSIKSQNVKAGGAAGMILLTVGGVSGTPSPVNAFIPTIVLDAPSSAQLLAFVAAHPATKTTWGRGVAVTQPSNLMADFSSRGPTGSGILKPDVVAPGTDNYGPQTPDAFLRDNGPKGQLYQGYQGTSFSTPIVAGTAALVIAKHPTWTPGQVKSALMTTANASILSPDGLSAAGPFDKGSGLVRVNLAVNPGLTLDETAANFRSNQDSSAGPVTLNLPNIYDDAMPDVLVVQRVLTNVSGASETYTASTSGVPGTSVSPASFTVAAGQSVTLTVTINAAAAAVGTWMTGSLLLTGAGSAPAVQLPIEVRRGSVSASLATTCASGSVKVGAQVACSATITNRSLASVTGTLDASGSGAVARVGTGTQSAVLAARTPQQATIQPGSLFGYVPGLALPSYSFPSSGVINFTLTPAFTLGGHSYTSLGITQFGFAVPGGTTSTVLDDFQPGQTPLPSSAAPNSILAPFMTPLFPGTNPALYAGLTVQSSTGKRWFTFEWVEFNNDGKVERFQLWIGINGVDDVTYAYDPTLLPTAAAGQVAVIGVENDEGNRGTQVVGYQGTDYRVVETAGVPGGSAALAFQVTGTSVGSGAATGTFTSSALPGSLSSPFALSVSSAAGALLSPSRASGARP